MIAPVSAKASATPSGRRRPRTLRSRTCAARVPVNVRLAGVRRARSSSSSSSGEFLRRRMLILLPPAGGKSSQTGRLEQALVGSVEEVRPHAVERAPEGDLDRVRAELEHLAD